MEIGAIAENNIVGAMVREDEAWNCESEYVVDILQAKKVDTDFLRRR